MKIGISRCNTDGTFSPCTGQWERFGTHWTAQYIQLATSQVSGTQLITGISEYGHTDLHSAHKGGHDIDLAYGGYTGVEAARRLNSVDFSINTSSPSAGNLRQYYINQLNTEINQETDTTKKEGLELVLQTVNEILAFYDTVGVEGWRTVIVGATGSIGGYKVIRDMLGAIDLNLNPIVANGHNDHYHIATKPQDLVQLS